MSKKEETGKKYRYVSIYPQIEIVYKPARVIEEWSHDKSMVLNRRRVKSTTIQFKDHFAEVPEHIHKWLKGEVSKEPDDTFEQDEDLRQRRTKYGFKYWEIDDFNEALEDPKRTAQAQDFMKNLDIKQRITLRRDYEKKRLMKPAKIVMPSLKIK